METDEIVAYLKEQYVDVRVLADGSIAALCNLMTTRSVMLDCDEHSFKRRFCFANRGLADQFFHAVESATQVPTGGYVARRPEWEDRADPYLNDLHNRPFYREYEKGAVK